MKKLVDFYLHEANNKLHEINSLYKMLEDNFLKKLSKIRRMESDKVVSSTILNNMISEVLTEEKETKF